MSALPFNISSPVSWAFPTVLVNVPFVSYLVHFLLALAVRLRAPPRSACRTGVTTVGLFSSPIPAALRRNRPRLKSPSRSAIMKSRRRGLEATRAFLASVAVFFPPDGQPPTLGPYRPSPTFNNDSFPSPRYRSVRPVFVLARWLPQPRCISRIQVYGVCANLVLRVVA